MILKNVSISDFKSVVELNLPLDKNITALVGANEHGKTNLLLALSLLDFKKPIQNQDRRSPKDLSKKEVMNCFIEYTFSLNLDDLISINNKLSRINIETIDAETGTIELHQDIPIDIEVDTELVIAEYYVKELKLRISYLDGAKNEYKIHFEDEVLDFIEFNKIEVFKETILCSAPQILDR